MTHFWQAHHFTAGEKNPPSSVLMVFHLYRFGVTTSNILEILAYKLVRFALHWEASRCQSTKRLAWPPTLRGGENSDTNILINLTPSPSRPRATLLLQSALYMAVEIGFLCHLSDRLCTSNIKMPLQLDGPLCHRPHSQAAVWWHGTKKPTPSSKSG